MYAKSVSRCRRHGARIAKRGYVLGDRRSEPEEERDTRVEPRRAGQSVAPTRTHTHTHTHAHTRTHAHTHTHTRTGRVCECVVAMRLCTCVACACVHVSPSTSTCAPANTAALQRLAVCRAGVGDEVQREGQTACCHIRLYVSDDIQSSGCRPLARADGSGGEITPRLGTWLHARSRTHYLAHSARGGESLDACSSVVSVPWGGPPAHLLRRRPEWRGGRALRGRWLPFPPSTSAVATASGNSRGSTHTPAHSRTLPHTLAHSRTLSHTLAHSRTLSHAVAHSPTLPHTLARTQHTLAHSRTLSHTPAHPRTLSHAQSRSLTLACSLTSHCAAAVAWCQCVPCHIA